MRYCFCKRFNAGVLRHIILGRWENIKAKKVGFNRYNLISKNELIACNISKRDVLEIQQLLSSMNTYGFYKGELELL